MYSFIKEAGQICTVLAIMIAVAKLEVNEISSATKFNQVAKDKMLIMIY